MSNKQFSEEIPKEIQKQTQNKSWLSRLQERWGVNSFFQVVLILIVFALTGFSVLYVKKWLLPFLGINSETALWIRIVASIFVILPIYQVLLLFYGTIFGQFTFFWAFEKRMFGRIAKIFRK